MASNETVTTAEQIIANHAFFMIEDCANYAEAAVIFHEYLITLDSEIRLIWRRKITGASVLFMLNRYIFVFQNAITVTSYWPLPVTACNVLGWMDIVLNLIPYFIWNAFSTLRVYALCGRDWRLASLVSLLMIGPIFGNLYNIPTMKPDDMAQPYNCSVDNGVSLAMHNRLVLISRCSLIAADSIVLAVTWWKTYRLKKAADAANVKTSIVDLLLRDGAKSSFPHSTMLVLNVLHILINFVEQVSFMGDISDVLTSILVSRFIMNLRDLDTEETSQTTRGTILFNASGFVQSMGEPLDFSSRRSDFDESPDDRISHMEGNTDISEGKEGDSEDAV
ncbi:hypothetical protein OH77DRAFT_1422819 [Trametes cingulata]|nr:hypothetical protein OH77DRAFT_1422819 [Trametes cingulata]